MTKRERRTFTPEFKNQLIDQTLAAFQIGRSLSMKDCPYDNAVAEATFKIIKTEFISQMKFDSLEYLTLEFSDYVNWYNKLRIHGTLGYVSPLTTNNRPLKKLFDLMLTIQYGCFLHKTASFSSTSVYLTNLTRSKIYSCNV